MPLGWGRAVGSYVASHFGSLGRPPGTKKGILQLYNNETGLSSSTQLQNHATRDDRKTIRTSAESSTAYCDNEDASKQHYNEDGSSQDNSQTINLEDGLVGPNYVRSLQIGALLAVCYNLLSGHLRLRAIQAQKPIFTANAKKTQLLISTEKSNQSIPYLEQNGQIRLSEVPPIEPRKTISFSNWYYSPTWLHTTGAPIPPTSAINSFLLPRVFESLLPSNSILPNKKSVIYKPNLPQRTFQKHGAPQYCMAGSDIKCLEPELKPIFEGENDLFERKVVKNQPTNDQNQETIDVSYQEESTSKPQNTNPVIDHVFTPQSSLNDEVDQSCHLQSRENITTQSIKEPEASLNSAEAEMLRTSEMIDLVLNASEALKLLDMGYHQKGMEILKAVARCSHAESNFNLGVIFERGLYGNKASIRKATKYYVRATKLNYPASFYNLGLIYEQSANSKERLQGNALFEKAAELGLVEAKKKLGHVIQPEEDAKDDRHGKCKMCQDIGWRESEDSNITVPTSSPETCYTLARAYHYGKSGMPQDKKYALELYREAAINGHKKSKRAFEELKIILSTDPLKNEKTKDCHQNNLIGRVKKRAEQKISSKFIKKYYRRSNLKSEICQSNSGRKSSDSYVEFDSNVQTSNDMTNSQKRETNCHMMTAV